MPIQDNVDYLQAKPTNCWGPPNYYQQPYPYGYYRCYPDETTTIREETCEYDDKGKLIKKTVKTTTTSRPRSYYSQPYWTTTVSNALGGNTVTSYSLQSSGSTADTK